MDELIGRLTENGKYANEVCLFFLISNDSYMLEYFDKYEIRGKKLETFVDDCNNYDIETIREVLLCLDWDLFDIKLVHQNLESSKPIPFIEERMLPNEGFIKRYQRYRDTFTKNMKQNNKGR